MATAQPAAGRVLHLDVLRAIAILLVMGSHRPEGAPAGAWGQTFLDSWQRCGWAGVDLFFALSGYLIVGLLLAERHTTGSIDVTAFALRRVFKIYPPYSLYLIAVIVWSVKSGTTAGLSASLSAFRPAAVHLQNYMPIPAAPHLWSLAMEEHCYLLMLGLVIFASRRADPLRTRVIPFALVTVFAASWLGRWAYLAWRYSGAGPVGFAYTHNRLDAVVAGSLVAWMVQRARFGVAPISATAERRRRLFLAVSAVCFVPTLTLDIYLHRPLFLVGVLPLQALGFGLLLLGLSAGAPARSSTPSARRGPSWFVRFISFIGISSYSTYLWHLPFAALVTSDLFGHVAGSPAGALVHMVEFVAVALGMGAVSYQFIERPALALRRRALQKVADGRVKRFAEAPA